jgi:hypothetical protein
MTLSFAPPCPSALTWQEPLTRMPFERLPAVGAVAQSANLWEITTYGSQRAPDGCRRAVSCRNCRVSPPTARRPVLARLVTSWLTIARAARSQCRIVRHGIQVYRHFRTRLLGHVFEAVNHLGLVQEREHPDSDSEIQAPDADQKKHQHHPLEYPVKHEIETDIQSES